MNTVDTESWEIARRIVQRALRSSLFCSITSINADGSPHVTPIGSLTLLPEPGRALYFDVLNVRLGRNVDLDPRVSILAVDSRKATWLGALVRGRFDTSPGVQLDGCVGPRRSASADEARRFERSVQPLLHTKGGKLLWKNVERVRDVTIESMATVRLGAMTRGLAPAAPVAGLV